MPGGKKRLFTARDSPRLVASHSQEGRGAGQLHNRKGLTYTFYRGQTKTGKPHYYFSRAGQGPGEPVKELPPSFTIGESVNGVVSLVKDHPPLIQPEEVAVFEAAVQQHPEARWYWVAVKHDRSENKALDAN